MAKGCANHKEQAAATMCHQCHLPICRACITVTPHGSFCSAECSLLNRDFKERLRRGEVRAPGGAALKLLAFFLLVVVVMVGIHLGAKRAAWLRPADLIGRLLGKVEDLKPR